MKNIGIDRDERHPSISASNIAGIDNISLNNILNSIIPTSATDTQGTTQYLLPVDLVVLVDNKSNKRTVQAALPSSFALQMTPLMTPFMTPLSIQNTLASLQMSSALNPSAPSFHPHTQYTSIHIPRILQDATDNKEEQDAWCIYDSIQEAETPHIKYSMKPRRRVPTYSKNCNWRNRTQKGIHRKKLMAEFVQHVTLPNREEYIPNKIYTKTWAMRNNGNVEWGYNVELVWCKGDKTLSLYDRYPVINAQPQQVVEISATIKTSIVPKRYCAYFRLKKNDRFFGPRVWVDIIVGTLDHTNHHHCATQKAIPQKAIKWKKKYCTKNEVRNHSVVVSCQ